MKFSALKSISLSVFISLFTFQALTTAEEKILHEPLEPSDYPELQIDIAHERELNTVEQNLIEDAWPQIEQNIQSLTNEDVVLVSKVKITHSDKNGYIIRYPFQVAAQENITGKMLLVIWSHDLSDYFVHVASDYSLPW